MGQKSNPIGLRLQINRTWDSRWYAEGRDYAKLLKEDIEIRKYIVNSLPQAAISKVVIERPAKLCRISIYAARPGVIIGKKGADIEKLRTKLSKMTESEVKLNIVEIRKPEIDAKLVAQGIADQLIRRVAFRRAMKRAVQSALRLGAEGIKITCGGRLGGAEIARGMTNFSSEETMVLARHPEISPKELLGYQTGGTVISRENLIVLEDRHLLWDKPEEETMVEVSES